MARRGSGGVGALPGVEVVEGQVVARLAVDSAAPRRAQLLPPKPHWNIQMARGKWLLQNDENTAILYYVFGGS